MAVRRPLVMSSAGQLLELPVGDEMPLSALELLTWFGDGADGNVTVTGAITLARDMFYANLTISGAGSINCNGYRVFVSGTLDLTAAGAAAFYAVPQTAAANAVASAGGVGGTAGQVSGVPVGIAGGSGTAGQNGAGLAAAQLVSGPMTLGGDGGACGASGSGNGGANAGAAANAPTAVGAKSLRRPLVDFHGNYRTGSPGQQGGGGAGDGTQGGGGGASGPSGPGIFIAAKNILRGALTAVAAIQCKGGNGSNGGTPAGGNRGGGGGGGGAGGGFIGLLFESLTGSTATNAIDVSGGNGGNGGNGTGTGQGGNGGDSGAGGRLTLFNLALATVSDVLSAVGRVAGGVRSGTTGGTGATATTARMDL